MRLVTFLTALCALAPAAHAASVPAQFVDEWAALGTPLYGQQSAALVNITPAALKGELPVPAAGAQYAVFNLRDDKGATVPLVAALTEQAGNETLFVDTDGDGALAATEAAALAPADQRPPGFGRAAQTIWMARIAQPQPRTVLFRLSAIPGMIAMAVRGHGTAELTTGKGPLRVHVVDANANLVLDEGVDALYADLNADGKLDGTGERIVAGPAMDVADLVVAPTMGAPLSALTLAAEPAVDVPVRFAIAALKDKPLKFVASVLRQGGDGTLLTNLDESVKLRVGSLSVESLSLGIKSPTGVGMFYNFQREGAGATLPVRADTTAPLELIGKITLQPRWTLTDENGTRLKSARPGAELQCEVDAVTATGLKLVGCSTGTPEENFPTQTPPRMALLSPAGKVVFSGAMTFG
ncbi:MAG: hypothetical protein KKI08_10215 [Armatimonadetes bacterium]|nr:hypothetical protein [Armatimonadota bacterium]